VSERDIQVIGELVRRARAHSAELRRALVDDATKHTDRPGDDGNVSLVQPIESSEPAWR
jgi:hypothetical protein